MNRIVCLGIESTAHTFGVGIVDQDCKVLANEKAAFVTEEGGIFPREAADYHLKNAKRVIEAALERAGKGIEDVGLVAFSQGPGLGPCLRVGAVAARTIAHANGIPLLGVNHCVAHIEIGKKVTGAKDPIVVYASGANTQVIGYGAGVYRVYGETLDIGIGNLLDSFGRALGLGFPAGPKIDEMYFKAKGYVELPYSVKGMDLAFSGLQTAAELKVGKVGKEELSYSLMHTAFAMLTEVSERALAHTEKKELLLTGGVGASKALKKMLGEMCEARGTRFFETPAGLAVDNGAMIAWLGIVMRKAGVSQKLNETIVDQRFRTDAVEVCWE